MSCLYVYIHVVKFFLHVYPPKYTKLRKYPCKVGTYYQYTPTNFAYLLACRDRLSMR